MLAVQLTAAAGVRLVGRDTMAWGFNGTSPGPTLRVRPGDLLRVRLVNRLDQPTNLHTHGLHVSPQGNGDNPFVHVEPGASFDYEIRIPIDHPAGTFWYHPHHHGTAADQLFGGLAGALLVDGGPALAQRERVLLVTDTTLAGDGSVAPVDVMTRVLGREGALVLVNGQHQPVIAAAPGATERWRVINGCTSRVLALRLEGHRLTQAALDGRFLPTPTLRESVVLAPGNRADLLVRPTAPGAYSLVSDAYPRGSVVGGGTMNGGAVTSSRAVLAILNVAGPAMTSPSLPLRLPAPVVPPDPISRERRLTFAMGMNMGGMGAGGMMSFTIDGRTFDTTRDDQTIPFGATEEWTVTNTSPMVHPFHLHVWPVHVVGDSTGTPPLATQQDVVLLPAHGWARVRIAFSDYPGRSVYHCHVLDHEDAGMMATAHVQN
ncbi:multicopper oxidase family protein [Amycolatopsis sp. FDAARGOS 1241]|uniref:multicopper oxidase family protein n=1 Tax=Amycolatopsis sp. FDAARGOS 1241 TaxID=2778070 RepID=UPI001EF16B4E|nr:multicopper oxidase family protein [Amycolatopsis sp. FDAARGOS 1241]